MFPGKVRCSSVTASYYVRYAAGIVLKQGVMRLLIAEGDTVAVSHKCWVRRNEMRGLKNVFYKNSRADRP
jgi:hypothetical protein